MTSSVSGLLAFFPTASLSYVDIFIVFEIFDALKPIMVRDLNLGETNLYKLVDDAVAEHRLTSELHDVYISHFGFVQDAIRDFKNVIALFW